MGIAWGWILVWLVSMSGLGLRSRSRSGFDLGLRSRVGLGSQVSR